MTRSAWALVCAAVLASPLPASSVTDIASVATNGVRGNADVLGSGVSGDGHFIAFDSEATTLVPGDTNGVVDAFVRDRTAGVTERVSVGAGGAQGNGPSSGPSIGPDGRFVTFISEASNLVPGDTNGVRDCFLHDRLSGATTRVSVGTGGVEGNGRCENVHASADASLVVFTSLASNLVPGDANALADVFVHDRSAGTTTRVNVTPGGIEANAYAYYAKISGDGQTVAFSSPASNLIPGDAGWHDVFAYDRPTDTLSRVSVASGGAAANGDSFLGALSFDGRWILFSSAGTNLPPPGSTPSGFGVFHAYLHDRLTVATTTIDVDAGGIARGYSYGVDMSPDARFVAFWSFGVLEPADTNNNSDVYVRDLTLGTMPAAASGPSARRRRHISGREGCRMMATSSRSTRPRPCSSPSTPTAPRTYS